MVNCLLPAILQCRTGLPLSTYFSAVKLRWLLDNVEEIRQAVEEGRAMFGTVDSWIIWVSAPYRCLTCSDFHCVWILVTKLSLLEYAFHEYTL